MKKVTALVFSFLLTGLLIKAETTSKFHSFINSYDGSSYIFIEDGVEFSVFPDGQFDFVYLGYDRSGSININQNGVNINFNSGYDYDVFVQYDDYGAVIQVENIPIYYDEFGRIIQAGNTEIHYNDRRIVRIGGLRIFYDHYGYFSHYTGYINFWTPYYVYRPWHVYYIRPFYSNCIVYDHPYRRYYTPFRYSYKEHRHLYKHRHRHNYRNARRDFYRPGSRIHHRDGRVVKRRDFDPRRTNSFATENPRRESDIKKDRTAIRHSKEDRVIRNRSRQDRRNKVQNRTRPVSNAIASSHIERNNFRSNDNGNVSNFKKPNSRTERIRRNSSTNQNERGTMLRNKKNNSPSHRANTTSTIKSSKNSMRSSSGQRGKR